MAYVLLLVLLAAAAIVSHLEAGASTEDASIVYCTASSARIEGLVTAAVSLGLAQPGSGRAKIHVTGGPVLPYARWRAEEGPDFTRACAAYMAANAPAQSGQESGTESVLDILLPVLAGAVLTLAADDIRQASGRRWAMADELRTAWRAFDATLSSFLEECEESGPLPETRDLDGKRDDLRAVLRKMGVRYGRSRTLGELLGALDRGRLGPSRIEPGLDGDTIAGIRADLDRFRSLAESLADGLEDRRPRLPGRVLATVTAWKARLPW